MSKRLFAIAALLTLIIVVPIYLYIYFTPENTQTLMAANRSTESTKSYQEYFKDLPNLEGKHLLFVINSSEDNTYIEEGILQSVLGENEGNNLSIELLTVDTSSEKDLTVTQLKDKLQIERTPALVIVDTKSGKAKILATKVYHEDEPFTKDDLKTWFFKNKIWTGPYIEDSE